MPAQHSSAAAYERRTFPIMEVKALDDAAGTFSGYLACFNNVDQGGDIIKPGAFQKSLADLQTKQRSRQSRYVLPIFWSHMPEEPLGGFVEAVEDQHGLFVKGELDLDIEQGRRAYSGLKRGYLSGMSIGYITVKQAYEDGARVLKELRLLEGSLTAIPMNEEAQVTSVKSATGKATWRLGDRDAAWDGSGAHDRIVKWATDDSGNVDTGKLKSVHFYSPDGDAADNISEYKLLFCDVVGGDIKAMPKGIFACAGSHGVDNTKDIPDAQKDSIRAKITAYYKRMAKQFDDDSIVSPWDAQKGQHVTRQRYARPADHKARDFDTLFQSLAQADDLQDEWGDMFIAFTHAVSECMWQQHAQANGWLAPDAPTVDAQEAIQSNLDAFSKALLDLVQRSLAADFVPQLDRDGDQFIDPDGCNADDGDECATGYMSAGAADETKAGRVMSAANHDAMGKALDTMKQGLDAVKAQHKALTDMHAQMSPSPDANKPASNDEPSDQDTQDAAGNVGKGGKSARTSQAGAGAGAASSGNAQDALDSSATPTANHDELSTSAREMAVRINANLLAMKLRKDAA